MALLTQAEARALLKPKRNKYGVAPKEQRTYAGRCYMSKLECRYAQQLDVWRLAGAVKDWCPQVRFDLHALGGKVVGGYVADFQVNWADGRVEIIDCKGVMTEMARWKLKHLELERGIKVNIVRTVK